MSSDSSNDPGSGEPAANLHEDRQAELLAGYDEALASGSTLEVDPSSDLDADGQRRFEENRRCLELLEGLFPRQPTLDSSAETSLPADLPLGLQIGRFTLLRELGRGGFGIVYLADDPVLCRQVALKAPRGDVLLSPELRERFLREARAAGRLNHPNLMHVLDAGMADLVCYIVSDYCAGPTLAAWTRCNSPVEPKLAARIVLAVARGVAYIHSQGVLHRDIKPSNILLAPLAAGVASQQELPFTPRLTDFGLARLVDSDCAQTATGAILGTPAYMSPEQAQGNSKELVCASDVYSLGAILYELCTGRTPFTGSNPVELLTRALSEEVIPLRQLRREVPRDLEALCLKCLDHNPQRRYETADGLADDLERFIQDRPTRARPLSPWKRGLKYARRRPTLAVATVLMVTLLIGGAAASMQIASGIRAHQELQRGHDYLNGIRLAVTYARDGRAAGLAEVLNPLRLTPEEHDMREFAWHYLWQQGRRLTSFNLHQGYVHAVAFEGDKLLFATNDGFLNHWNIQNRQHQGRFPILADRHEAMTFSADGSRLVTIQTEPRSGCQVHLWDTATGKLLNTLHADWDVKGIAISPDGRSVALGGGRPHDLTRQVVLWTPATNATEVVWQDNHAPTYAVQMALEFSPHGEQLAIACDDCAPERFWTCKLLDLASHRFSSTPLRHPLRITDIAFAPDGGSMATGGVNAIQVWDIGTAHLRHTLPQPECPVWRLAFSPDAKTLAAALWWSDLPEREDTQYVAVWDLATGTRRQLPLWPGVHSTSLAFAPDGKTLAVGGRDSGVRIAALQEIPAYLDVQAHAPAEGWGLSFAPGQALFATCGDDHLAKLWDLDARTELRQFAGAPSLLLKTAFAPHRPLLAAAGYDGMVRLWNSDTGEQLKNMLGHRGPVRSVAFSPDGSLLASAGDDRTVRLWNTASAEIVHLLSAHTNKVRGVAFTSDGKMLFSGGNDGAIRAWALDSGACTHTLQVGQEVWGIAASPHKPLLAIGASGPEIDLYRTDTWSVQARLSGHTRGVRCVAFSPDGRTLASGGLDRTVRLWQVATGQELLAFENLPADINGIAFSSDGRTLGAICHDGTARLWQAGN